MEKKKEDGKIGKEKTKDKKKKEEQKKRVRRVRLAC